MVGISKNPLEIQMDLSCAHLISSFCKFHKAYLIGHRIKINKEGDHRSNRVRLRKLSTQHVSFVELCSTNPRSAKFSSTYCIFQVAYHSNTGRVVTYDTCGRYVHKSCFQIMRLLCTLGKLTQKAPYTAIASHLWHHK